MERFYEVKIEDVPARVWRAHTKWRRWKALGLQASGALPGPGHMDDQDERLIQAFMIFEAELQQKIGERDGA